MTTLWTVLLPLAATTPDPAKVKPGWLAFFIVLALGAAVAFLGFSLRKHLGRVNFDENAGADATSRETPGEGRGPAGEGGRGPVGDGHPKPSS